jgi:hypothetical protein
MRPAPQLGPGGVTLRAPRNLASPARLHCRRAARGARSVTSRLLSGNGQSIPRRVLMTRGEEPQPRAGREEPGAAPGWRRSRLDGRQAASPKGENQASTRWRLWAVTQSASIPWGRFP